jgi:prepilin-type N-terminal cleavage/methylation domain-containing protein
MPYPFQHDKNGFTLIELSIVLVIIALLVGGILVGQELIKVAQVRATISQIREFDMAANTFRNKYNCLPGDCVRATTYGFAENCTNLGAMCGNGAIGGYDPVMGGSAHHTQENLDFWEQLSSARMISQNFPGFNIALVNAVPGTDFPAVKMNPGAGLWVQAPGQIDITVAPNQFWITAFVTIASQGTRGILLPMDNYLIDSKIDDGLPSTGKVKVGVADSSNYGGMTETIIGGIEYGPAGATSNFCATTDTPPQYNVLNITPYYSYPGHAVSTQCTLEIKASF